MQRTIVLALLPPIAGAIVAAVNTDKMNDATERAEQWIRGRLAIADQHSGKINRYAVRPFLLVTVKFCDWTDGLKHRGIKNGLRIVAVSYFLAFWCLLVLYAAAFIIGGILAVVGLLIAIKIMTTSSNDENARPAQTSGQRAYGNDEHETGRSNAIERLRQKGTVLAKYDTSGWFPDEEELAHVQEDGRVAKYTEGTIFPGEKDVVIIREDGHITKVEGEGIFAKEVEVGQVMEDGRILKTDGEEVAHLTDDGRIVTYDDSAFANEIEIAHVIEKK